MPKAASPASAGHSRRVGDGDIDSLSDLLAMSRELYPAIANAVIALHHFGYLWTQIADRLGTSRQNARQRWARGRAGAGAR